jgi:hypothetical protein
VTKSLTSSATQELIEEAARLMADALELLDQLPLANISGAMLDFAMARLTDANGQPLASSKRAVILPAEPDVGARMH